MRVLPTISIVTPTYNQGRYIEQTILSVLSQNYPNLEYIIIDGGSTDNTIGIIKKYERYLKFWVSEKDNGQANAINKGLGYCTGEIFNWLNSDDYLEEGALTAIAEAFSGGADLVAGQVRLINEAGETISMEQNLNLTAYNLMTWRGGAAFVQPGVWLKRELVSQCGGINERYHFSFDWDLYIRYLDRAPKVAYINKMLVHFRYHEQSKTVSLQQMFKEEEWQIVHDYSVQCGNRRLQQMAAARWAEKEWLPFLNQQIQNKTDGRWRRVIKIFKGVNFRNIVLWRATAGAVRLILKK